jgi:hypothetical protein
MPSFFIRSTSPTRWTKQACSAGLAGLAGSELATEGAALSSAAKSNLNSDDQLNQRSKASAMAMTSAIILASFESAKLDV